MPARKPGCSRRSRRCLPLIKDVVMPELQQSGLKPFIDKMGNLILIIKGRQPQGRLMLVGYAMCAAPSTMKNPYSGEIVDGAPTSSAANASGGAAPASKRVAWRR